MRGFFLTVGLILSGLSFAQGEAPPAVPAQRPSAPTTFIAQGEAVEIPDAGFTIVPPIGWEVFRNASGASLFFQAPKVEGAPGVITYQPNIRVMVINEPRPIDESTKEEYSKLIVEKNGNLGGVANFNVRSAEKVTFGSGIEGFLYYTEFALAGTPMMQMHVLVSSASKHFLMTYVDLASSFEAENSPGLTTAYTSMQGITLDSKPIERFANYYVIGGVISALLVLLIFIRFVRGYNMKRLGERIESEDGSDSSSARDDDDELSDVALLSSIDHQGDDELPETREASKPVPKPRKAPALEIPKPSAPRPAPVAPKPAHRAPAAPVPSFVEQTHEDETTDSGRFLHRSAAEDHDDEGPGYRVISRSSNMRPASDVSEFKPMTVVTTAKKAKNQKVANPAKMKDVRPAIEDEGSDVARLSEILPNTGDTKKKKSFFSWGKGKDKDDDDLPSPAGGHIGDEDSWDEESQTAAKSNRGKDSSKKLKKDEEHPMSEVAGWNLKSDSSRSRTERAAASLR